MSELDAQLGARLDRFQRGALAAGVAALVVCILGAVTLHEQEQFFRSYLVGFTFWAGIALGCFAVLLLHHIFGAGWGFTMQRTLEAGTRTFPLVAVLFLPLLVGMHALYEWTHTDVVAADAVLRHKSAYLNTGFFIGRTAFYFLAWIGVSRLLNRWSARLDETGDPRLAERLRNIGAPGLLVYGLTATFAMVDWVMSIDAHWFSTMFGLMFIAGQVLSTFAFVILVLRALSESKPMAGVVRPSHFHDIGNLTLAFTMIWAYLAFSQFLIIWAGNLPETITWFKDRSEGGWQWVAVALVTLSFALPFALLLSRFTKRRIHTLAMVAALILAMRLVDVFWVIEPTFHPGRLVVHWMDVLAPVGIGGIWLAFFVRQLKSRSLLPERDPRMEHAFSHAHAEGQ